jgi:type IV secretion system protein VirB2
MIAALTIQQTSLTDPSPASAIKSAASWVSDLLIGPLATTVAVIAIAWVGFAMLSGRIDIRKGLSVILGCFLLFGAREIADGLQLAAASENRPSISAVGPQPVDPKPLPSKNALYPNVGTAVAQAGQRIFLPAARRPDT